MQNSTSSQKDDQARQAGEAVQVAVFSHPNHELAIFGFLQRYRPHIVYLTDGGGEGRVNQTRQGLESIGLLENAHFLNYTEQSFYQALLECDVSFFDGVAGRLRAILREIRPARVLCDAIEFYNPVHDMALPLVRAALGDAASPEIFEVPLIYQTGTTPEAYAFQRTPASRRASQVELRLAEPEMAAKATARDSIYTILAGQMGRGIQDLPREHVSVEVIVPASPAPPEPGIESVLRYELRAQLLLASGEIERMITHSGHFTPVAQSLWTGH